MKRQRSSHSQNGSFAPIPGCDRVGSRFKDGGRHRLRPNTDFFGTAPRIISSSRCGALIFIPVLYPVGFLRIRTPVTRTTSPIDQAPANELIPGFHSPTASAKVQQVNILNSAAVVTRWFGCHVQINA